MHLPGLAQEREEGEPGLGDPHEQPRTVPIRGQMAKLAAESAAGMRVGAVLIWQISKGAPGRGLEGLISIIPSS